MVHHRATQAGIECEVPLAHGKPGDQRKIEPGADGGRKRKAHLRKRPHQQNLADNVDRHRGQGRLDGGRGIAAGEKRRGHAADQHERKQAERISGKRLPRRRRVRLSEFSAHKQSAHDEVRDQEKGDNARDRKQQR